MQGHRVLVTGGAGFIGSAVCRHLIGAGATVMNVDKLTYAGNLASVDTCIGHDRYNFHRADIADRYVMDLVFKTFNPTAVMHLAAESHVDRSITGSADFIHTNVVGTYTLLEVARSYWSKLPPDKKDQFRFLHVSTDEVYGTLPGPTGSFHEGTAYEPRSPYSASKASSDHLVHAWCSTYGLPTLITNCGNNYGPYQYPEKLIPLMILNAIQGKPLTIHGNGLGIRDWIHVDDHVAALVMVLTHGRVGQKYDIGSRNERVNLSVVHAICDMLDELRPQDQPHRRLITYVPDRPGQDMRYSIDPSKIERELGWKPKVFFGNGLYDTIQWYLNNQCWWGPVCEKVAVAA